MASPADAAGGEGKETSSVSAESSSNPATLFGHPAPSSATATHASTSLIQMTSPSLVPQKRKLRASNNFDSVMCEIHVGMGDEKIIFPVHKKVFVEASKYFAAAFDGGFSEGVSWILQLPEEDPELFGEIVKLVYRGVIDLPNGDFFFTDDGIKLVLGLPLIFPLYVALKKYHLYRLLNWLNRSWNQFTHSWLWKDVAGEEFMKEFSPQVVTWVYANSVERSRLRQFAVEMIQHHLYHRNSVEENWRECFTETPEIAVDLTRYLMKFVEKVRCPEEVDTDFEY